MNSENLVEIYIIETKVVSKSSAGRAMGKKGELKNETDPQ